MRLVIEEIDSSKPSRASYPQTICLNMIVKNEAHVILSTLEHLLTKLPITYWVISDTGSTDGTQDIIRNFFKERNIRGELVEHEWRDFGYNRTKALESAYNKTDYLFIFDADDSIGGDFVMPPSLTVDRYDFVFGRGFTYHRPLLVNNRIRWIFLGVLHEFLANVDPIKSSQLFPGDYYIESGRSGARNKDPDKYLKDAIILKNAFEEEVKKPDGLSGRYAFYCAQSYKDCNHVDDAIEWYLKCLDLNVWIQEKYHSCIMLAEMYEKKKEELKAIKYLLKASEYDPERIDGVVFAMKKFNKEGIFSVSNSLYHKYKDYKRVHEGKLFLFDYLYKDEMEFENSVAAFYSRDLDSGYKCCKQLLSNQIANLIFLIVTVNNLQFYKNYIEKDSDTLLFFYGLDKVLNEIVNRGDTIQPHTLELWNIMFQKNLELLMNQEVVKKEGVKLSLKFNEIYKYNKNNNNKKTNLDNVTISKMVKNPKVIVTFTTCKRFDLFQQTMDSLLNHWENLEKIDYWFCVDDNSSEEDRESMRKNYGWIDYYWKSEEEKGHRKSMNLIYDKLKDLKPTYWIHIEDDFLFHNKMDYFAEGIRGLESLKSDNVKQVIFNVSYGETIENYHCKSYTNKNNGFSVHDYKKGDFPYVNCHYWPHFSFRPGITDVRTILSLGNFDSENEFFEMDYAVRWTNAGFKTGFFNRITCRHIGRLTSERSDSTKANAYTLNKEGQLGMGTRSKNSQIKPVEPKSYIQIINLEKRVDRKEETQKKLVEQGFQEKTDFQFIKAVDGYTLEPTLELKKIFEGNDFGYRKGFIGAALSHLSLWKQLLNDSSNDFYLIMEDDFTFIQGTPEKGKAKAKIESLKKEMKERDVFFLGYHMFDEFRDANVDKYGNSISTNIDNLTKEFEVTKLNYEQYIGGFFAYSINKKGAQKMVDYIQENGIKHGIDWLFKIYPGLDCYELQPQLLFSVWNEKGKEIDTNIQNNFEVMDFSSITDIKDSFIFIPGLDQCGNDIHYQRASVEECMEVAWENKECVGFNTLGFFKNKIDILKESPYFNANDGVWIKKTCYELWSAEKKALEELVTSPLKIYSMENSRDKNFCFIHSCHLKDSGTDILKHLVSVLKKSGLLDNLEKVFVFNYGEPISREETTVLFGEETKEKIVLLQVSSETSGFEVPTIRYLHDFCKRNEDCNILYLHTKGISRNEIQKRILDWVDLMLYFLVEKYPMCLEKLATKEYDVLGCNYLDKDYYGNDKPHFSGNFWWVRSGYMSLLDVGSLKSKHDAEFFILSNQSVRFSNLYHSYINHYVEEYPRNRYEVKDMDSIVFKEKEKEKEKGNIRVKMLCNWCSSETLCKRWSNMCDNPTLFTWKNLEIVWSNENIDYYVIINRPQEGEFYEPSKTIVFQMEPWINDQGKPWGVKTWGDWAIPDEKKFLAVRGRHNPGCWNNVFWELELTLKEIQELETTTIMEKRNTLGTMCSSKYFDEGHILRIDFLKYLEKRLQETDDFKIDIYNWDNNHQFTNFRGGLDHYVNKSKGVLPYKYYFMVENNFEKDFITEKLWEPILCETLVFYYGCPNVSDYINPLAYVQLDIYDFDKSYQIIKTAIEEDWWSQRISVIREEKKKILNEMAFLPVINGIIEKDLRR